jgi:hypothetical protein
MAVTSFQGKFHELCDPEKFIWLIGTVPQYENRIRLLYIKLTWPVRVFSVNQVFSPSNEVAFYYV